LLIALLVKSCIEIGLLGGDRIVDHPREGDAIELVEHGLVKPLSDAASLRTMHGASAVDVPHGRGNLIFMVLRVAARLGISIGKHRVRGTP
jgi:hypothetical protein